MLWLPVKMGNGDDQDRVTSDMIDDPIWEPTRQAPAGILTERLPASRESPDPFDRVPYLPAELRSQTRELGLVVRDRFSQIIAGSREQLHSHAGRGSRIPQRRAKSAISWPDPGRARGPRVSGIELSGSGRWTQLSAAST